MNLWTNKEHRTVLDDADDFAYLPCGGRVTQWVGGVGLALAFIASGVLDLRSGHALIHGRGGEIEFTGASGAALSTAYIALGTFFHFHWFWGLSETLWQYSQRLKVLALLIFLPCFLFTLYRFFWA